MAPRQPGAVRLRAALLDFDGTISTLRAGWETVMRTLMLEILADGKSAGNELARDVDRYIDESTGIQTIYQMEWLAAAHERCLGRPAPLDAWAYKREYTARLKHYIHDRVVAVERGDKPPEAYMIRGAAAFLQALCDRGIALFLASGTDHPDVLREAAALGVAESFADIQGAPPGTARCSKEEVIHALLRERGLQGQELLVVGDGKVEIGLGRRYGGWTLGVASDERARTGINPVKLRRLCAAGAHAIVGDFGEMAAIAEWIGDSF
ncbi:MAG: HAD family hydrolase [Bacilli bacterium]